MLNGLGVRIKSKLLQSRAPDAPQACAGSMVDRAGPLAADLCKPRQARKGATVAAGLGAGMWLARDTSKFLCAAPSPCPCLGAVDRLR